MSVVYQGWSHMWPWQGTETWMVLMWWNGFIKRPLSSRPRVMLFFIQIHLEKLFVLFLPQLSSTTILILKCNGTVAQSLFSKFVINIIVYLTSCFACFSVLRFWTENFLSRSHILSKNLISAGRQAHLCERHGWVMPLCWWRWMDWCFWPILFSAREPRQWHSWARSVTVAHLAPWNSFLKWTQWWSVIHTTITSTSSRWQRSMLGSVLACTGSCRSGWKDGCRRQAVQTLPSWTGGRAVEFPVVKSSPCFARQHSTGANAHLSMTTEHYGEAGLSWALVTASSLLEIRGTAHRLRR